jgi:hypothetical protein
MEDCPNAGDSKDDYLSDEVSEEVEVSQSASEYDSEEVSLDDEPSKEDL